MKIGYARVSTEEQHLDLQLSALENAGCDKILSDHGVSGSRFDRSGLNEALNLLQNGDTLLVWRLDRLGRSLRHLVEVVSNLGKRGVEFVSLTESIDTRTSTGMLMFHMIAALAEFERSLISERTRAGMVAARARGAKIGRPRRSPLELGGPAEPPSQSFQEEHVLQPASKATRQYQNFLRSDWMPGYENPVAHLSTEGSDPKTLLLDCIKRSRRRSDERRIGRGSRYACLPTSSSD